LFVLYFSKPPVTTAVSKKLNGGKAAVKKTTAGNREKCLVYDE